MLVGVLGIRGANWKERRREEERRGFFTSSLFGGKGVHDNASASGVHWIALVTIEKGVCVNIDWITTFGRNHETHGNDTIFIFAVLTAHILRKS